MVGLPGAICLTSLESVVTSETFWEVGSSSSPI